MCIFTPNYLCCNKIMANKSVKCLVCNDMFTKRSNMYAHMRNVHKLTDEKICVPRVIRKRTKVCTECGKAFTAKHNLQRHIQKVHDAMLTSQSTRIKCPLSGCEHSFPTHITLRDHLNKCHEEKLLVEELQFASEQEFLIWKEDMQVKTVSLYVADTSKKIMSDGTQKKYYNCHRSYTYRGSGQNKRRLKNGGSIKIGTTCPARLEVTIKDGLLNVKFWKTHIGHSMDVEHIHLSKAARTEIADKMKQGETFQQILNDIHIGKLQNLGLPRARIVKRKDLHNIYRDFHIASVTKPLNGINESEILREEKPVSNHEETTSVQISVDNVKHSSSFQEIFDAMQSETIEINESTENYAEPKDIHENTFNHCNDISVTSTLKETVHTGTITNIEEIHQLAANGSIILFEEQHFQTPTVIHLAAKNQEFTFMYYEEVGVEDCTISDQEIPNEKDQNGFPIIYHEEINPDNCKLTDKLAPSTDRNSSSKSPEICCPLCGRMFTLRKNLYSHLRVVHKLTGANDPVSATRRPKTEICSICGKGFTSISNVRRHKQKIHREEISNNHTPRIKCPDPNCKEAFNSYTHLRGHLFASHQKELENEEMHFISEKDFEQWRESMQAETVSLYVLDTARKVLKDGTVKMYYNCHRSHSYKSSGKNIRKLKSSGTSKIGLTCPSRLEVFVRNGLLDVKFWKTHMGHDMDVGHTTLSKAVRTEIAELLKQGATFEHILDLACNGKLQTNQSQRTPLIKRKDLHNICRDYRISLSPLQSTSEVKDVNWCIEGYKDR